MKVLDLIVFLFTGGLLCLVQTTESNEDHQLYILSLLPHPNPDGDPSWAGGPNVLPAMRLAIKHIQQSKLLSGYNLSLIEMDGGCNYTNRARISFMNSVLYSRKQIVGLIGPGCSASSVSLAPLTVYKNIALVNIHGAGTPQLGNHTKYPFSFGIFGSSNGIVAALSALIENRGWREIAVLYDSFRIFQSSTHDILISQLRNATTLSITSAALNDEYYHLDQIVEKRLRVVVLLAGTSLARNVMCVAYEMNMTYPNIQWVIVERLLTEFGIEVKLLYRSKNYTCTNETMINKALNGSVVVAYKLTHIDPDVATSANISSNEFDVLYQSEIEQLSNNNRMKFYRSPWGTMYYDTVWIFATVLSRIQSKINLTSYGLDGTRNYNDTLKMSREIEILSNFTGVSGRVEFSIITGYNKRSFDILQIFNGSEVPLAYFDVNSGINNFSDPEYWNILSDEFPRRVNKLNQIVTAILSTIVAIVFSLTFSLHCIWLAFRNNYFVRAASLKITQFAFFGCYLLLLTCCLYIIIERAAMGENRKWLCHVVYILCSFGFTLIFATNFAKIWRLFRVSNYAWKPGRFISDKYLVSFIMLATIPDVLINTLWIILDPVYIEDHKEQFNGSIYIITEHCDSNVFTLWYIIIYAYHMLFVVSACVLAVYKRRLYISGFQTSAIGIMSYSTTIAMFVGVSVQVIIINDQSLDPIVLFIGDFIVLMVTVLLSNVFLFIPPVSPKFKEVFFRHVYVLLNNNLKKQEKNIRGFKNSITEQNIDL